ncbi:MAG: DMT family transporter [Thermoleophilia bacterium]|nr:DMT family transporter [Thermoleophilia bacterium]
MRVMAEIGLGMAGLIWGANFVLVKLALEHMPPLYYLGLRFLVGTVLLAPFSLGRLRRLSGREWLIGCGVGFLLFCGFALQTIGLRTISPGLSGFLTNLYVIGVPLMLGLATGRWPSKMVWVGIAIVIGGMALLSLYGQMSFGWGEILTLVATIFWAVHILAVAHASVRMSAVALVQLQLTVCAVLSLAYAFIFERPVWFPGWEATGAVLWTGAMGGVVAYMLMALGQRYTPPTLAGVLMSLEAVFALVVSIIFGYDSLTLRAAVGFVLVFAGCSVARMGSEKTPEYAAEPAPPGP